MTQDTYLEGLSWLHEEIVVSLGEAVERLAAYQESRQADTLEHCREQLQQVQGSLEIAGCRSGVLLLAEMLRTLCSLQERPAVIDDGCVALAQAVDVLPRHLARLQQGETDHPALLMGLFNELRAVQGRPLFSEESFFAPDLSPLAAPATAATPSVAEEWSSRFQTLSHFYQAQLIPLLKGELPQDRLRRLIKVIEPLEALFAGSGRALLWRAAGGFFEALLSGRVAFGPAARTLLGSLERELRLAAERGPDIRLEAVPLGLMQNLLFYVALAGRSSPRRASLWREFHLEQSLPAALICEQQTHLDDELVAALSFNLSVEVAAIKTALEDYLADDGVDAEPLRRAGQQSQRMTAALTMAGQPALQALSSAVDEALQQAIRASEEDREVPLDGVATAIVDLEIGLFDWSAGAWQQDPGPGSDGSSRSVLGARLQLLEEISRDLEDLKGVIVEQLDTGASTLPERFHDMLQHLATVLPIAGLRRCAVLVDGLRRVTERWQDTQFAALADVLTGMERYLENCRDGRDAHQEPLIWAEDALLTMLPQEPGHAESVDSADAEMNQEPDAAEVQPEASPLEHSTFRLSVQKELGDDGFAYAVFTPDEPAGDALELTGEGAVGQEAERASEVDCVAQTDCDAANDETIAAAGVDDIAADTAETAYAPAAPAAGLEVSEPEPGSGATTLSTDTGPKCSDGAVDADDGEADDGLRDIFIEEAREVLGTLNESYPRWQAAPGDQGALVDTRRAFHTLKGSGRMVGAQLIGEFAWAIENLLNRLMERRIAASPELHTCVESAIALLPQLIVAFERDEAVESDAVERVQTCAEALARGEDVASVAGLPTAEAAPGRGVTEEPLAEVGSDSELLEIFLSEAYVHLDMVRRFCSEQYQRSPLYTPPGAVMQSALHTLKGSAHMAAIEPLAQVATALEQLSRGLLTTQTPVDEYSLSVFDEGSVHIEAMLQVLASGGRLDGSDARLGALLKRCEECRNRIPMSDWGGVPNGVESPVDRLLNALMRDCLDQLIAMEHWLERGRDGASTDRSRFPLLAEELAGAAIHARANGCTPLDSLATAFEAAAIRLSRWPDGEALSAEWRETLLEAREALLQMCDALAANQDVAAPPSALYEALAGVGTRFEPSADLTEGLRERLAQLDLADDADRDIVELFLNEAEELLEVLEQTLHEWREGIADREHPEGVKRVLHTFKGGARMAALDALADISHELESEVERHEKRVLGGDGGPITLMLAYHDALAQGVEHMWEKIRLPGTAAEAGEEPVEVPGWPTAEIIPFAGVQRGLDDSAPEVDTNTSQEAVRLAAPVLNTLVNLAGEASISRGQVEQHVNEFMGSLDEMEVTIRRMHDQVRRLGIETDAQVMFRREQIEASDGSAGFDPLEMDRYSQLQQLARSLLESASDLQDLRDTLLDKSREAETLLLQQSRINTDLQENLMRTRMVPFTRMVPRLRRIVRQVASALDKQVVLQLDSVEGELDRSILERIVPALEHMVRNAIDHGIEPAQERLALGKPAEGTLSVSLAREGGDVLIRLTDDGRGLNVDAIRDKAVAAGLMSRNSLLSDEEIHQFIFAPGLSTARDLSDVSGRGVGMDVVNSEVRQLGGSVAISSQPGAGTEFTVRLPFTLSVNRALMIRVKEDAYALPLNTITGVTRIAVDELLDLYQNPHKTFLYGGESYQVRYLGSLLAPDMQPMLDTAVGRQLPVILMRSEGRLYAVQVDGLDGSREVVVKTLGAQFSRVPGLSGATVLGDGSVVVILDLQALLREQAAIPMPAPKLVRDSSADKRPRVSTVMVVDDSVTVRKVTTRFLEREGFNVLTAKDGIDAMRMLQDHTPDLMLLDIEMPRMDGFEVTRLVRSTQRLKDLPIVMITSRTGEKHRERALSMGADNYLGKPYQEDVLVDLVRSLLRRGRVPVSGGQAG